MVTALVLAVLLGLPCEADALELVRGPYLQRATTDSMTVVFDLDEAADAEVHLGLQAPDERVVASPSVGTHHEVTLTGLAAGTRYHYAVHADDTPLSTGHTLRTAASTGSPFTLLALGDTRSDAEAHASVIAPMTRESAHLVVHTGDLVSDGEDAAQWDTFFSVEQPLISRLPLYPVVGNHDEFEGDAALYREAFVLPGNELYYSFDYGNAHFVVLDGYVNAEDVCVRDEGFMIECLDDAQLQWLQSDLATACTREGTQLIFVLVHDGPYSSKQGRTGSPQLRALLPLFAQHRVTAILSGHDHYYERGVSDNGILYVITAGGGAPLYDLDEPCSFPHTVAYHESLYHYVKMTVAGTTLHLQTKAVDGRIIDETTIEARDACNPEIPEPPPAAGLVPSGGACGCRWVPRAASALVTVVGLALLVGWVRRRRR